MSCWKKHFEGEGGIARLMPIAVPMMLTSLFDTAMMFVDRLYLSRLGKAEMAACMAGGTTSWTCMVFFVGLLSYASAIVARQEGARKYSECGQAVTQSVRIAFYCFPVILLAGLLASQMFRLFGHTPEQQHLELHYFWWCLAAGGLPGLLRAPFSSFFSGIGNTKVIMWSNVAALVVNLVANYVLIFGHFGFPQLGIDGAALGTVLSSLTMSGILAFAFLKAMRHGKYQNPRIWESAPAVSRALWRFGAPGGLTQLLCSFSFSATIAIFHSLGVDVAAAVTIDMSWELFAFLPMMGLQIGVTTLTGQCLGAEKADEAERAVYSGMKVAIAYSLLLAFLFVLCAGPMVSLFTPEGEGIDYTHVTQIATMMVRLTVVNIFFDAAFLIFCGGLQGGGDTIGSMTCSVLSRWLMLGVVFLCVSLAKLPVLICWAIWNFSTASGLLLCYLRFQTGKWKHIKLLGH